MNSLNSSDAISSCLSFFKQQRLEAPFIPDKERPKFIRIQDGIYGSKEPSLSPYDIGAFVQELLSKPPKDYVLLGLAGHGVSSRAIHYYAVRGPLAVFIQLQYSDIENTRNTIDATLDAVEMIYKSAVDNKKMPEGKHLLVVQSDLNPRLSGWGWIEGKPGEPGEINEATWHRDLNSVNEALKEVKGL